MCPISEMSQTPDKAIWTLCAKCATQEVFDSSHFMGKIERSQRRVLQEYLNYKTNMKLRKNEHPVPHTFL